MCKSTCKYCPFPCLHEPLPNFRCRWNRHGVCTSLEGMNASKYILWPNSELGLHMMSRRLAKLFANRTTTICTYLEPMEHYCSIPQSQIFDFKLRGVLMSLLFSLLSLWYGFQLLSTAWSMAIRHNTVWCICCLLIQKPLHSHKHWPASSCLPRLAQVPITDVSPFFVFE